MQAVNLNLIKLNSLAFRIWSMGGWALEKEQRSRGSIVYNLSAYLCEFYVTFVNIIKRNLDTCGGYSVLTLILGGPPGLQGCYLYTYINYPQSIKAAHGHN